MITVHHLKNSRSMRIIWLMEELGLDYELKVYDRNPETNLAPEDYRALHPLGKAPLVTVDGVTLAETGAIVEYFLDKHPESGLRPDQGTPERVPYQYWMHAAEGSLMPLLIMQLFFTRMETTPPFPIKQIVKAVTGKVRDLYLSPSLKGIMSYVEAELGKSEYFAGDKLSGADIMMSFPLEAGMARANTGIAMPNTIAWLERIHSRPAYKAAVQKGGAQEIVR